MLWEWLSKGNAMNRTLSIACFALTTLAGVAGCHGRAEPQTQAQAAARADRQLASGRSPKDEYVVGPTAHSDSAASRALTAEVERDAVLPNQASRSVGEAAGVHVYYIVRQ